MKCHTVCCVCAQSSVLNVVADKVNPRLKEDLLNPAKGLFELKTFVTLAMSISSI